MSIEIALAADGLWTRRLNSVTFADRSHSWKDFEFWSDCMTLKIIWSNQPLLSGWAPIREYNGFRGGDRGPFNGQWASASNHVMGWKACPWRLSDGLVTTIENKQKKYVFIKLRWWMGCLDYSLYVTWSYCLDNPFWDVVLCFFSDREQSYAHVKQLAYRWRHIYSKIDQSPQRLDQLITSLDRNNLRSQQGT